MKQLNTLALIMFLNIFNLNAQNFINGSFENTTVTSCSLNNSNSNFNSKMSNVFAFGTGEEIDIKTQNCFISDIPDGAVALGIANNDDIAIELSSPLISGNAYNITFQAFGNTFESTNLNDLTIGSSLTNVSAGVIFATANIVADVWTEFSFNFIAPNNGNYITVNSAETGFGWTDIDMFVISCQTITGTDIVTACNAYTWIDGNTYTTSNNTATYNIVGGASSGCDSLVTLDLTINNSVTGTDSKTACNALTWIDGNTYTTSNNTATYNIVGGAANGCDSLVTLDLTINSVADLTTSTTGVTITANNAGATYQWLNCDNNNSIIDGQTSQSFTATSNGNYAVELTENGCIDTSDCVEILTVGIVENSFGADFVVYPNPTNGNFSVDLGAVYENANVTITDMAGKLIFSSSMASSQTLNLSINEAAGIYIVSIQASTKKAIIRLVKE